jgi:hypothetical protein
MSGISAYLWLIAGLFCLWIGTKAVIYIEAYDSPQSMSALLFVAPVCFYQFYKARRAVKKRT